MNITDAKQHIGQVCRLSWTDRGGDIREVVSKIHDVTFVPLYGGFVITEIEDIRLDKITAFWTIGESGQETMIYDANQAEVIQAA